MNVRSPGTLRVRESLAHRREVLRRARRFAVSVALAALASRVSLRADDLLPDLIVPENPLFGYRVQSKSDGTRELRFTTSTANIGRGPIRVIGLLPVNEDGTQAVDQIIESDSGAARAHRAGNFVFHEDHGHVHAENWASYRLRARTESGAPGEVVAEGGKTSFCLVDLVVYDRELPRFPSEGRFHSCKSLEQGISVGWSDVYHWSLEGQSLDVTDVADGEYWLEVVVDPADQFIEEDETNNSARILVVLGTRPGRRDAYEPNDSPERLLERTVGGPNSPNLGPVGPSLVLSDLTIHTAGNEDWFRFYSGAVGDVFSYVSAVTADTRGRLTLALFDSSGENLADAGRPRVDPRVSLAGLPAGWYFVQVTSSDAGGVTYELTLEPPANAPPAIAVTSPVGQRIELRHGLDQVPVAWEASDPDGDPLWVSVFLARDGFDDPPQLLETSRNTPAEHGVYTINSAEVDAGEYRVFCQVTDGGTKTGAWAETIVVFAELPRFIRGDCDGDGRVTGRVSDALFLLNYNFAGGPTPPCFAACDANGDGIVVGNVVDALYLLNYNFSGGPPPPPPLVHCGPGVLVSDDAIGCAVETESCPE